MKTSFKLLLAAALVCCLPQGARAQKESGVGVPADIYYLMPSFGEGMVWFSDKGPAEGQLNICAEDNSLRFMDNGKELVASSIDNVVKVRIDSAVFVRKEECFYRIYPVSETAWLAVRRNLDIQRDAQLGAYGGYSRTSSIREQSTLYSDGVSYKLESAAKYPYSVSESYFLYENGSLSPLNKRSLRKLFPQRKDDIDAYLKSKRSLPDSLSGVQSLISRLLSGEPL